MKLCFRRSVYTRASVILFFGAFVAIGLGPPMLLLFGAIDFASAVWTYLAIRSEAGVMLLVGHAEVSAQRLALAQQVRGADRFYMSFISEAREL